MNHMYQNGMKLTENTLSLTIVVTNALQLDCNRDALRIKVAEKSTVFTQCCFVVNGGLQALYNCIIKNNLHSTVLKT